MPGDLPTADTWHDAQFEAQSQWRDRNGSSPIDVLRSYLRRRHEWEQRMARQDPRPGSPTWDALWSELDALYRDLCTPRRPEHADRSVSTPPSRDVATTRISDVVWEADDRVVVHTFEPELGGFVEAAYGYAVVRTSVGWRLHDRMASDERGGWISGVL